MATSSTSFVALYDMHFGWEYQRKKGNRVVVPTHNIKAIKTAFEFMADMKPDVVILGGDQLNCGPVSHWHHGKPRLDESFRLKAEMDLLEKHVLTPLERDIKPKRKIWLEGNHERFIQDFLDLNPGVEGLVEPVNYLNLLQRKWEFYDLGEIFKLGKLNFIHGDTVRGSNPARKLCHNYRRNIRAGDKHTYQVETDLTAYDRKDYHTAVIVPALCSASPAYMKNRSGNFQQGLLFGWVRPDGNFSDYVAIINNGRMTWGGKTYGK